jgi:outer membrane protein assembly factor BamB
MSALVNLFLAGSLAVAATSTGTSTTKKATATKASATAPKKASASATKPVSNKAVAKKAAKVPVKKTATEVLVEPKSAEPVATEAGAVAPPVAKPAEKEQVEAPVAPAVTAAPAPQPAGVAGTTVFTEEPPRVLWSVELPDTPQGLLDAGGGLAYVALTDGTVRAYRLADGSEAWKASLDPSSPDIAPQTGTAWMRGTVFVADTGRNLRALVASSGTPAWDAQLLAQASSEISARGDLVVVGEGNRACAAFNAGDGRLAWRSGVLGDVTAAPFIGDREVVFGTTGHKMYAAARANGEFTRETVLGGEAIGRPGGEPSSTRKSLLAMGVHDGRVYAFTGGWQRAWVAKLRGVARAAPLVRPDGVLVGTDEGVLYLLDKDSGAVVWRTGVGGPVADRMVIQPAGLVVGAGGTVIYVDPSNGRVRSTLAVAGLVHSVAEDAGTVVATTSERRLVAVGVRVVPAKPAPPKPMAVESLVTDPPVFNARNAPPGLLITFSLTEVLPMTVDVADARGRRVKLLTNRDRAWPGTYRFEWLGTDEKGKRVSPGVYRVRVTAGDTEVSAGIEVAGIK